MDEKKPVDGAPAAAPTEVTPVVSEAETRIATLEAEKAKLIEESSNWKVAALKYKKSEKEDDDLDEDDKMKKIAQSVISESRLAEITREQDEIIRQALKENRELKLARSKPNDPPAGTGTHTESTPVRDTVITQEQLTAFKARGWDDKTIERYKKNLIRYSGR